MSRQAASNRISSTIRSASGARRTPLYRLQITNDFWPSDLIAFWDFSEQASPFYAKKYTGNTAYPLSDAGTSNVVKIPYGPFGSSVVFNGANRYLKLSAIDIGDLNIAQLGDEVTVMAWYQPSAYQTGFIGGIWDETNGDGRRQYGLFHDLPTYGGDDRLCCHISADGGPTPGYPYNKDYAASARWLEPGYFKCVAMTYDGSTIKAYIDGVLDNKQSDNTNPYPYTGGLNRVTAAADFTVGACKSGGMINYLNGLMGGLAVFKRVLTAEEIMGIHVRTKSKDLPILHLTFHSNTSYNSPPSLVGWSAALGTSATDTSTTVSTNFGVAHVSGNRFLFRNNSSGASPSIGYFSTMDGLPASSISKVVFLLNNSSVSDSVHFLIEIDENWYATDEAFSVKLNGYTADNWATAERQQIDFSFSAAKWRDVTFIPGITLSIASSARSTDISDGTVRAIGFYSPSTTGTVRIDSLSVW